MRLQVLHYAQELFEGMKAYRGVDGKIRFFRPMHNMARMNLTATRACLPNFDGFQLLECIRRCGGECGVNAGELENVLKRYPYG